MVAQVMEQIPTPPSKNSDHCLNFAFHVVVILRMQKQIKSVDPNILTANIRVTVSWRSVVVVHGRGCIILLLKLCLVLLKLLGSFFSLLCILFCHLFCTLF